MKKILLAALLLAGLFLLGCTQAISQKPREGRVVVKVGQTVTLETKDGGFLSITNDGLKEGKWHFTVCSNVEIVGCMEMPKISISSEEDIEKDRNVVPRENVSPKTRINFYGTSDGVVVYC